MVAQRKKSVYPNKQEFKKLYEELTVGHKELTLHMVGKVFGPDFWILLVEALLDAHNAARAIQGAIAKLKDESAEAAKVVM